MIKGLNILVGLCLSLIALSLCEQMMWNMDQCPDTANNTLMTFEDMKVDNQGDNYICTGNLVIRKRLVHNKTNPIKVKLNGYKCDSSGQVNCNLMKQFESKDLCADLKKNDKNNIVCQYIRFLGLDGYCPFEEGTYPLNAELPIQMVKVATAAGKHWLGYLNITDQKTYYACQMMQVHFEDSKSTATRIFG